MIDYIARMMNLKSEGTLTVTLYIYNIISNILGIRLVGPNTIAFLIFFWDHQYILPDIFIKTN